MVQKKIKVVRPMSTWKAIGLKLDSISIRCVCLYALENRGTADNNVGSNRKVLIVQALKKSPPGALVTNQ